MYSQSVSVCAMHMCNYICVHALLHIVHVLLLIRLHVPNV